MGQITLSIQYAKNTGLVFSSTELKNIYFTGIPLTDQFGNPIPEETIDFFIKFAQTETENELSIKLMRQAFEESRDFVSDDYAAWNYVPTTFPAVTALKVQGFLNTTLQITYPPEWLSTKRGSDEYSYWRSINMVPIAGPSASLTGSGTLIGVTPYVNRFSGRGIPNYWTMRYITGYKVVPADILNYLGRLAAIELFNNLGDILLGAGVANKSQSIDGLSQSIGTTASAMYSLFSARIESYRKDMQRQLPILRNRYRGYLMGSM